MSKRLFVGNLPFSTTKEELASLFAEFGATAEGVTIPTDHDGRSKGFAFVDINDDQLDAAVTKTNGSNVGGRDINVNEARPREDRPRSGGYSGGNGGGYSSNRGNGGYQGGSF